MGTLGDKLVIWSNAKLTPELRNQLEQQSKPHQIVWASLLEESNLVASGYCPLLLTADIAFGQPLSTQVTECPRLRWVHLTTAGFTTFDNAVTKEHFNQQNKILTNSSSVYSEPCAQHAAAFLLMEARNIPASFDNQRTYRAWPDAEVRMGSHLLSGQTVVILGYGSIGKRLTEILKPFRLKIFAFKRKRTEEPGVTVILEDELPEVLSRADHIINILPLNESTEGFFNRERLRLLKPEAVFYNIGRGQTIDQVALAETLARGAITRAYLDVTDPEPLPPVHPLWNLPNCIITPHSAGGFSLEYEALLEHFLQNLTRFSKGQSLVDRLY